MSAFDVVAGCAGRPARGRRWKSVTVKEWRTALAPSDARVVRFSGAIWEAFAQTGIRVLHSPDDLGRKYDYLIIGAGSAGCVLVRRLAQAGRSVLVIEAGGPATLPSPDWPQLQGSSADWRYVTVPQRHLGRRIIPYPRGKVVGGSSAINALAYQRGHRAAFDRWPQGWRFADLLPYFRRAETFSGGSSEWRGGDGPLHVLSLADVEDRTPLASAFIAAAQSLGFAETKDIGWENRGCSTSKRNANRRSNLRSVFAVPSF